VEPSPIHRWGIVAGELIPKGRQVIEYTGERISRVETARRGRLCTKLNYLFTLDNYWTLDGSIGGSGAEFINHCCEPNCKARITDGHIYYYSKRDIQPGEELTVDYRFDHRRGHRALRLRRAGMPRNHPTEARDHNDQGDWANAGGRR